MERALVNLDFYRNVGLPDRRRVRGLGLRPFVVYPPSCRGGRFNFYSYNSSLKHTKPQLHSTNCVSERQTWSSTLRKEFKFTVFGNRVQRGISGRRKIGVSTRRQWKKKLYNDYVYNLYFLKNAISVMESSCGMRRARGWAGTIRQSTGLTSARWLLQTHTVRTDTRLGGCPTNVHYSRKLKYCYKSKRVTCDWPTPIVLSKSHISTQTFIQQSDELNNLMCGWPCIVIQCG